MKKAIAVSAFAALAPLAAQAQTVEEKIDALQKEIDRLKSEVSRMAAAPAVEDTTSLFGYGEFNYNRYRDGAHSSRADLRRFVLGVGHRFDERLSFASELELEHAVVSKDDEGEIEVEQAYVNYQSSDALNVKGGLFLIPLGILNEAHEPPTYYGVERNEVETRIIPTTWRELGVGVHGALRGGLRYDVGLTTGFNAGKLDDPSVGIRSAHQEGQLAAAHDLSVYGALNYNAPGLLLGGGLFTGNTGQDGEANPLLKDVAARLTLWDVHARYSVRGLDLQALYAAGTLGDAERLNAAILATSAAPFAAPKSLKGWYAQVAYHVYRKGELDLAPFVRYERFEIRQQEDPANGLLQDPRNLERVRTMGFNLNVHPQVVIKADLQRYAADRSRDRLNVGLGYLF
jgi:Phosphate-selective porin O and P